MRIICLGDSNTTGFDPRNILPSEYERPWPTVLSELLNKEVINYGENGIGIYHTKEDFDYLDSIIQSEDLVIIMLGLNDVLRGVSLIEIENRLNTLLHHLQNPIVLICPKDVNGFVSLQKIYSKQDGFVLNCNEWNIEMSYDGIHFSENGHEQFAYKVYEFMKCM